MIRYCFLFSCQFKALTVGLQINRPDRLPEFNVFVFMYTFRGAHYTFKCYTTDWLKHKKI